MDCVVPGCGKQRRTYKGQAGSKYCVTHAGRIARYRSVDLIEHEPTLRSSKRHVAYVDNRGYLKTTFFGVKCHVHRLVYLITHGEIPKGHHVHHKDGNKLNNHWNNLEAVPEAVHRRLHMGELVRCRGKVMGKHKACQAQSP